MPQGEKLPFLLCHAPEVFFNELFYSYSFCFTSSKLTHIYCALLWLPQHDMCGCNDLLCRWHCTAFSLHCTALLCTIQCTEQHYTALHCTALQCTALHCTALHCTSLHCIWLHCTSIQWRGATPGGHISSVWCVTRWHRDWMVRGWQVISDYNSP